MEYELNFNNEKLSIEIAQGAKLGAINATINGTALVSEISRISENCLMIKIGNNIYKAYVGMDGSKILVHLAGQILTFERTDSEQKTFSRDDLEYGAKDRVTTPMPGKVVKILVAVGETIKARQPLVIVESMKMENEIKSPADGVVKSVNFAEGDLVGTGQPIILLEPDSQDRL